MFNFFKKKPADLPDLFFKSNESAFQYACEYFDCSLDNEQPVVAIVLEAIGGIDYCVKIQNPKDSSIPTQSLSQLLESGDISNICPFASALDRVPPLVKGDLVMYVAPAHMAAIGKGHMTGIVIAKIHPQYSIARGGWRNANAG